MDRLDRLRAWIAEQYHGATFSIEPASADASFRRYFRVRVDGASLIAMDAPPPQEDCAPFVHVAKLFLAAGVNVPKVLAQNLAEGYLLLTDLGSQTYLNVLHEGNADELYLSALNALVKIQLTSQPEALPAYDESLLLREMRLFPDWYVAKHKGVALTPTQSEVIDTTFRALLANNLAQPRVYVHRDYHSRNLMQCEPNPGILDFQDAVYGPITYDAVSLLKDAYVEWEEERLLDWLIRYWEFARKARLPVHGDFALFHRDFEWMGLQRHIKVLGIFARLYHRDGKDAYLKDLPLVMKYTRNACQRYREFAPFLRLLDQLEQIETCAKYTF